MKGIFLGCGPDEPIAANALMRSAIERLLAGVHGDTPLLVGGESGVGVGWLTSWANRRAQRGPLVVVSLASIAEDRLPAHLDEALRASLSGTLLVRAFDAMSAALQREVLAQSKGLVIATYYANGRPGKGPRGDTAELFERSIMVPPLRERREDIAPLSEAFWPRLVSSDGVSYAPLPSEAIRLLERRDWPGNVRELRNMLAIMALRLDEGVAWSTMLAELV